jgi:nitroimidazol reductase NimA-like FMN-containing flavoprotein (pyridoxamine 5'-phosphate oxidase superfamily)
MRNKKQQITDRKKLEEILKKENLCRIALCDKGVPYIIPMNYGYLDGSLYFHCATEGRKLEILRVNDLVGFEVESDVTAPPVHYKCVIGTGRATILQGEKEVDRVLDNLCSHFGEKHTNWRKLCTSKRRQETLGIRIDILEMTGKHRRYSDWADDEHAH